MLPIAIVNTPVPVPLVNTTLPGTAVVHVPYDNVAPSISNAQVDNNASPNSEAADSQATATTEAGQAIQEESAASAAAGYTVQSNNVQAEFLAQLLSQDGSPATQVFLVQYEKMTALSNVKYKPSNAMKPVPQPATAFEKILQQNRPIAQPSPPEPAPQQQKASLPIPVSAEQEAAIASQSPDLPQPRLASRHPSANAGNAYAETAARVEAQNVGTTTALA